MPVLVVGNLTVGGTGKTPLVISLVEQFRELGFKPGVISRGYAGKASQYPMSVLSTTSVFECGDEPALIVRRTGVPMAIGPNRKKTIQLLLANNDCDLVISDDGLQHYAMQRDIDICVIDQSIESSNTLLLPAGPFREPVSRITAMDFVVQHMSPADFEHSADSDAIKMTLECAALVPLLADNDAAISENQSLHAVAGIGQPRRFFNSLETLGFKIIPHAFPDHHVFSAQDLDFADELPIVMTEKDAVKCQQIATQKHWYLPVSAKLSTNLSANIAKLIERRFKPRT